MLRAIQMRAERDAFVGDLAQIAQAEDLKSAGIGENRVRPRHELVQAAHLADQFVPGPEEQVIRVAENDLRAEVFQVLLRWPFTVAAVPTGMNAGVSIMPCGVVMRPSRAPVGSVARTSKEKGGRSNFVLQPVLHCVWG